MAEGVERRYSLTDAVETFGPEDDPRVRLSDYKLLADAYEAVIRDFATYRNQERQRIEEERCESCDDTGIYTEGDEWMPCDECDLGRGFAERLKSFAAEARQRERQRIQEALEKLRDEPGYGSLRQSGVIEAIKALADLDTLDPSGEKKGGANSRRESELLQLLKEAEGQRDKARKEREQFASREIERIAQYMDLADCVFSRDQIKAASDDDLHAALKSQLLKSRIVESHPSGAQGEEVEAK